METEKCLHQIEEVKSKLAVIETPPPASSSSSGKGKGKGKGKAPPLPKCKPFPKPAADRSRKNGLVNVHWKGVVGPPYPSASEEAVLKKLDELLLDFGQGHATTSETEPQEPCVFDTEDEPAEVWELPRAELEAYFSVKEAPKAWQAGGKSEEPKKLTLIDEKRLQMLGILWRKHRMAYKEETPEEALETLRLAVLQCDENVIKQEGLCLLRTVLRHHAADGNPVLAHVKENGEASLELLGHPTHHKMLYLLLKVPQVDERLESMLFRSAYRESVQKCLKYLDILREALGVLERRRHVLQKFFRTAHSLGQALNRDSRAPEAPHGFQVSGFERVLQTKTSKSRHNMMHIVLALMDPDELRRLFKPEDIADLREGQKLKSATVYQECLDLVQGFHAVKEIAEKGSYTNQDTGTKVTMERRRKTMALGGSRPIDADDLFHEVMGEFVEDCSEEVDEVAQTSLTLFQQYRELAIFFGDLKGLYPPPKGQQDPQRDMLDVFYALIAAMKNHAAEVEADGLRALLLSPQPAAGGG